MQAHEAFGPETAPPPMEGPLSCDAGTPAFVPLPPALGGQGGPPPAAMNPRVEGQLQRVSRRFDPGDLPSRRRWINPLLRRPQCLPFIKLRATVQQSALARWLESKAHTRPVPQAHRVKRTDLASSAPIGLLTTSRRFHLPAASGRGIEPNDVLPENSSGTAMSNVTVTHECSPALESAAAKSGTSRRATASARDRCKPFSNRFEPARRALKTAHFRSLLVAPGSTACRLGGSASVSLSPGGGTVGASCQSLPRVLPCGGSPVASGGPACRLP